MTKLSAQTPIYQQPRSQGLVPILSAGRENSRYSREKTLGTRLIYQGMIKKHNHIIFSLGCEKL